MAYAMPFFCALHIAICFIIGCFIAGIIKNA